MSTLKEQLIQKQQKYSGLFSEILVSYNNDYLLVEFCYNEKHNGLEFSADFEKETYFSSDVIKLNSNHYVIIFEQDYVDNIYYYFERLNEEINEGYLCPHNLFF